MGPKNFCGTMDISHELWEVDRPNPISTGVWTRGCYANGIYCTHPKDCCDYRDDKCWCCRGTTIVLVQLEEECSITCYHQNVEKQRHKF